MKYVLIGADIVPTASNLDRFINGDRSALVGEELDGVLRDASFRIFNLEVPLTDRESPISKMGPKLIAPTAAVNGYQALGIDLLTLANNHILDQDVQGLRATEETLTKAGIRYLGVGKDLASAAEPFCFDFAGKKIGVYACVEHEFSLAEENRPGANPFDPLWSFDHVRELKSSTDYVIVLYHGGKEHYRYPSPNLQKICRRFVDKGADLVVCQHSHCIGSEEKYKGGTIVYGQGNFIFDGSERECWNTSLLIRIEDDLTLTYLPIRREANAVRQAGKEEADRILEAFYARSEEIKDPETVKKKYEEFADEFLPMYLSRIQGEESTAYRALNKLSGDKLRQATLRRKYDDRILLALWDWIDCEAHRELLLRGIKNKVKP